MDYERLCTGCMTQKENDGICPVCGWDGRPYDVPHYIAQRTILNGRYYIGKVLGHGGFGITYLAWDMVLNTKLAIKEYFPVGYASRSIKDPSVYVPTNEYKKQFEYGLEKFMEEARLLAQFDEHPGIVSVKDFFKANGTAYMVMNYLEGITLDKYLNSMGGKIPFDEALKIMTPVMDALSQVHNVGVLHRDISPDNIIITNKEQVKILDFGAARYAIGETNKSLSIILKRGYAPEEQYRSRGIQGPWTDVYALAATLYRMITGEIPPEALDRLDTDELIKPSELGIAIPERAERVLIKALSVNGSDRYQSMDAFKNAFTSDEDIIEPRTQTNTGKKLVHTKARGIKKYLPVAIPIPCVALIVIACIVIGNLIGDKGKELIETVVETEETSNVYIKDDPQEDQLDGVVLGNTIGNTLSGGEFALFGDILYHGIGGLYKSKLDGSDEICLDGEAGNASFIHVFDDAIYYAGLPTMDGEPTAIYRINPDGTGKVALFAPTESDEYIFPIKRMVVQNEWIYFIKLSSLDYMSRLYRMKTDGSELTQVSDVIINDVIVLKDFIVYFDLSNWIRKMNFDGTGVLRISYGNSSKFASDGKYLYYIDYGEHIVKMEFDGSDTTIVTPEKARDFNLDDEWIYYSKNDDMRLNRLYKIKKDGSEETLLCDKSIKGGIYVIGDWIYFTETSLTRYKIKKDGTQLTELR